jgi:hypothetical protein
VACGPFVLPSTSGAKTHSTDDFVPPPTCETTMTVIVGHRRVADVADSRVQSSGTVSAMS